MAESRFPRVYPAVFLGVAVFAVGSLVVRVLEPFGIAAAWALVLAVGFQTPWRALERRFPRRRGRAALGLSLAIALLVLLPATVLGIILVNQAVDAGGKIAADLAARQVASVDDALHLPAVERAADWIRARTGLTVEEVVRRLGDNIAKVSSNLAAAGGGVVKGILNGLATFVMTIFLLFFFFRDGREMTLAVLEVIPLDEVYRLETLNHFQGILQSIFRGTLLCALIQGATGGVGWALAGLPSPVLAGTTMGALSLLPVGGTALVWAPGAVWLWLGGHAGAAVFLVLWGAVVTSFLADNVLKPVLMKGTGTGLSTLVVFVGVFGGIAAFGLLGLFFGPIVLGLGLVLLDVLRHLGRDERPKGVADRRPSGASVEEAEDPAAPAL